MIKFHFDLDFDATAYAMVTVDAEHHLFVCNPARLASQPCWAREQLANTLVRMALTPPPTLTAEVVDLEEFRQWCDAVSSADAGSRSASV